MKGVYVLLIHLPFPLRTEIGSLGTVQFSPGYYAYVGSALGGVDQRVGRHLRKNKKVHWHIDYLLSRSKVVDVVAAETDEGKECAVAQQLAKKLKSVHGFGCSDCTCESHLFFRQDFLDLLREVLEVFKSEGLKPVRVGR